jgi:hypothetical protein
MLKIGLKLYVEVDKYESLFMTFLPKVSYYYLYKHTQGFLTHVVSTRFAFSSNSENGILNLAFYNYSSGDCV